jgi:IclR family acetate operon transcriptional repressor
MSESSSLQKALDAVQLVALRGELRIRDFGEALLLPRSTAHRLATSLVKVRLLEVHKRADGDVYSIGRFIEELKSGQLSWQSLVQHAREPMSALRDQTGETVGLHVLYAERRVLLDQVVSQHSHRWVYNHQMVPRPLRAGAAAKMLLALLPEADRERLIKRDQPAQSTKAAAARSSKNFARELAQICELGVSMSAEEVNPGVASIAVPVIRDTRKGQPLTVLSVAAPSVRLTSQAMEAMLPMMRRTAQQIASAVSHSNPVETSASGRRPATAARSLRAASRKAVLQEE